MWDSISHIDESAVERITELGGISAIALSHPHLYGSAVEWSRAFGDVPIYVHESDVSWLCRDENVVLWSGETTEILPGRTLINAGVPFVGGLLAEP